MNTHNFLPDHILFDVYQYYKNILINYINCHFHLHFINTNVYYYLVTFVLLGNLNSTIVSIDEYERFANIY